MSTMTQGYARRHGGIGRPSSRRESPADTEDAGYAAMMAVFLDHTILEVTDLAESVAFYRDIVGLEPRGPSGPFEVMLITPDLALDLELGANPSSRHLAFGMDRATFDDAFARIRASGHTYGDRPSTPANMQGPGRSSGVHGVTDSVYFHDPSGHILEILTYDPRP
jgi:catechol 2,3-dioxygenase-like lactoylglutathione lyase family enzyme